MKWDEMTTMIAGQTVNVSEYFSKYSNMSVDNIDSGFIIHNENEEFLVTEQSIYKRTKIKGTMSPAVLITESDLIPKPKKDKLKTELSINEIDIKGGLFMRVILKNGTEERIEGKASTNFPKEWSQANARPVTEEEVNTYLETITDSSMKMNAKTVFNHMVANAKKKDGKAEDTKKEADTKAEDTKKEAEDTKAEDTKKEAEDTKAEDTKKEADTKQGEKDKDFESSNIFNTGRKAKGRQRRTPLTEAEKAEAALKKEQRKYDNQQKATSLESSLTSANKVMTENPQFLKTVSQLQSLILGPNEGFLAVKCPVTTTDTKLKAHVINLIKPANRQYHPNAVARDSLKSGKEIEAKYALGNYEVKLVESNPGTVSGFIVMLPTGLTVDHMNSLTNAITMAHIDSLATQNPPPKLVAVAIDRSNFTALLAVLNAPAYHVNDRGLKDMAKPYFVAEPRQDNQSIFWYVLKAFRNDGKVTKVACEGYLPISTYNTTSLGQVDQELLTQAIFSKVLLTKSAYTQDNKYSQLEPSSAAMFTGTVDNLKYIGFKDTLLVPAYTNTNTNPTTTSMKLPAVELSTPAGDSPAKAVFKKSRFSEIGYQPSYMARMTPYKPLLSSFRRGTSTGRSQTLLANTARSNMFAEMIEGSTPRTSKPIM